MFGANAYNITGVAYCGLREEKGNLEPQGLAYIHRVSFHGD